MSRRPRADDDNIHIHEKLPHDSPHVGNTPPIWYPQPRLTFLNGSWRNGAKSAELLARFATPLRRRTPQTGRLRHTRSASRCDIARRCKARPERPVPALLPNGPQEAREPARDASAESDGVSGKNAERSKVDVDQLSEEG